MIQDKALKLSNDKEFKASKDWAYNFLKRNGFSIRKKTRDCARLPKHMEQRAIIFRLLGAEIIEESR